MEVDLYNTQIDWTSIFTSASTSEVNNSVIFEARSLKFGIEIDIDNPKIDLTSTSSSNIFGATTVLLHGHQPLRRKFSKKIKISKKIFLIFVQTCELTNFKFGLYNRLTIDDDRRQIDRCPSVLFRTQCQNLLIFRATDSRFRMEVCMNCPDKLRK